jgi:DNA repair protein RecO (recombination protein O)
LEACLAKDIEQLAFVLHRRPYRETSLLVTFFTPDYGKQNAIIKGVRSGSKSAQAKQAWLQPFQGVTIGWRERAHRTSDLVSLRQLEASRVRFPLMGESNLCGLYVNELLYRLLYPGLESETLFQAYQQTLYDLARAEERFHQAWVLRQFEFELLSELGVAFQAETDHFHRPVRAGEPYLFHLEQGLFPRSELADPEGAQGVWVSGDCLLKFAQRSYCETCLKDWKRLFRYVLSAHLGDKPIQTRALFKD